MKTNEKQDPQISVSVTTTDTPVENAPRYELTIISEILDAVDEENISRFLSDFEAFLRMAVPLKSALMATIQLLPEYKGQSWPEMAGMQTMVWIDDNPRESNAAKTDNV